MSLSQQTTSSGIQASLKRSREQKEVQIALWVIEASTSTGESKGGPAVLCAYEATNVSHELHNSEQAGARDTLGPAVSFTVPCIAGGKVYVGTASELDILGLLSQRRSSAVAM